MDKEVYDKFLDDSTHLIAEKWKATKGRAMDTEDLYVLNEVLDEHFREYAISCGCAPVG